MGSEQFPGDHNGTFSLADLVALILDHRRLFAATFLGFFALAAATILFAAQGEKVVATIFIAGNAKEIQSRIDNAFQYQAVNRDPTTRTALLGAAKTQVPEGGASIVVSAKSAVETRAALLAYFADLTSITLHAVHHEEYVGKADLIAHQQALLGGIAAAQAQISSATANLTRLEEAVTGYREQIRVLEILLKRGGIDRTTQLMTELKLTEYRSLLSTDDNNLKFDTPIRLAAFQSAYRQKVSELHAVEYKLSIYPRSRVIYGPAVVSDLGPSKTVKLLLALIVSGLAGFFIVLVTVSLRRYKRQVVPS